MPDKEQDHQQLARDKQVLARLVLRNGESFTPPESLRYDGFDHNDNGDGTYTLTFWSRH